MTYRNVGILYALIIVALIVAKLAGYLPVSWWLVLIPLYLPVVLIIVVAIIGVALLGRDSAAGRNPFQ